MGPDTPLRDLIPDGFLETIIRVGLDSEEAPPEVEFAWPRGGANQRHFLVSVSRGGPSDETAMVAFFEVTEWKRRQHERMEASRLVSLGDAVAGVAHEINNPLAAIMGLSQLALRQALDARVRRDLERVLEQAKKAAEVVASLQLFGGVVRPVRRRIDIVRVLERALDTKRGWFRASDMAITTMIASRELLVDGDAHQLEQVFINIVTNAQQAMAEGGGGTLTIEAGADGDRVLLSFIDDGPGIDGRDLPRIFDPFFTTREVGEGSGLGLSMAYRIINEHGGSIRADSAPGGRGARFVIELSRAKGPSPESPEEPAVRGGRPEGMRVLVVEDEELVADVIARAIGYDGHRVDVAASGSEVVGRGDLDLYDLILMDMKMPGVDGAGLYEYLRGVRGDLTSRIVIVTGDTASIETQEFIQRTGSPVLAKPFTLEELMEVVRQFGSRAAPGTEGRR